MNIIFLRRHGGNAKTIRLSRWQITVFILLLTLIPFGLGYVSYGALNAYPLTDAQHVVRDWKMDLDEQRHAVDMVRDDSRAELRAIGLRIAQLRARLVRLDALGERLTQISKLDTEEFGFGYDQVGVGGVGNNDDADWTSEYAKPTFMEVLNELSADIEVREGQLSVLESLLASRNIMREVHLSGRPIRKGWLSSHFGRRKDPFSGRMTMHKGVDFAAKDGSDIIAVGGGVVTWAGKRYGYGLLVEVNHGGGYVTRYAHCKSVDVKVGDIIRKGDVIAKIGSTGRSTGPHVHFELRVNGKPINPIKYVNRK